MLAQESTIYLVRHGETEWNRTGKMQGHTDLPLNTTGIAQAYNLRKVLNGVHFDSVYSSDLKRAIETAQILRSHNRMKIHTFKEIRERSFGAYEGTSSDTAWKELTPVLDNYNDTHPLIDRNGVETNSQMRRRIFQSLLFIAKNNIRRRVLVVAHHGVIKQLLIHIGHSKPHQYSKGSVQNLAYIKLTVSDENIKVEETYGINIDR